MSSTSLDIGIRRRKKRKIIWDWAKRTFVAQLWLYRQMMNSNDKFSQFDKFDTLIGHHIFYSPFSLSPSLLHSYIYNNLMKIFPFSSENSQFFLFVLSLKVQIINPKAINRQNNIEFDIFIWNLYIKIDKTTSKVSNNSGRTPCVSKLFSKFEGLSRR